MLLKLTLYSQRCIRVFIIVAALSLILTVLPLEQHNTCPTVTTYKQKCTNRAVTNLFGAAANASVFMYLEFGNCAAKQFDSIMCPVVKGLTLGGEPEPGLIKPSSDTVYQLLSTYRTPPCGKSKSHK